MKTIFSFFFAIILIASANAQQPSFVGPIEDRPVVRVPERPCPDCPPCPEKTVAPKNSYSTQKSTATPGNVNQSQEMNNEINITIGGVSEIWPYSGVYRMFPPYGEFNPGQPYYPGNPGAPGYSNNPSLPAGPSVWQEFRGSPAGKGILNWVLPIALLSIILLGLYVLGKKMLAWGNTTSPSPVSKPSAPVSPAPTPSPKTGRSEKETAIMEDLVKTAKERGGTFHSYPDNGYTIEIPPAAPASTEEAKQQ